jgi:short-subunit dehydrogenase
LHSFASSLGRSASQLKTATVFPGPTETAQARANAPLGNMEDRSAKRMSSERVAKSVVRSFKNCRSIIIPGGANRFLAFLGVVFPGMTRSVLKSLLFKKLLLEQLNLQIQRPQNDSESEPWKSLPEQP